MTDIMADHSPRCLKNMDDLLRCPICFDFLNIAMMTKCSHNFCSLCIRKYLAVKLHCPVCNLNMTEQDLRNNRTLDELIINFQTVRQQWSQPSGGPPDTAGVPPLFPETPPLSASSVSCKTSRQRHQRDNRDTSKKDGSILSHFSQIGPKGTPNKGTPNNNTTTTRTQKKESSSLSAPHVPPPQDNEEPSVEGRSPPAEEDEEPLVAVVLRGPKRKAESSPPAPAEEEDEEPLVAQVIRAPRRKLEVKLEQVDLEYPTSAPNPNPPPSHQAETSSPTETSNPATEDKKPLTKVECPVCSVGISASFINKHLDTCLSSGPKKSSLRSSGGSRMRPMGKLVYNLLSLQQLKRKLKECQLSVEGTREQLERKHKEFVLMYNAQCDSLTPRSALDIAKEVESNEKTRTQLQRKAKPVMVFSKNQPEEEIDTMHSNYRKKHSSEFSQLVSEVRSRMESKKRSSPQRSFPQRSFPLKSSPQRSSPLVRQDDLLEGEQEVKDQQTAVKAPELKDVVVTSDETAGDSDASISSSLPDIFDPDPLPHTDSMKTRSRSSVSDAAVVPRKRKCKKP